MEGSKNTLEKQNSVLAIRVFKKDKSQEKGFWQDEETWFDDKNRVKQNYADLLKDNKWLKEAKRQQQELDNAKKDVKVIQINESDKNNSNINTA